MLYTVPHVLISYVPVGVSHVTGGNRHVPDCCSHVWVYDSHSRVCALEVQKYSSQ